MTRTIIIIGFLVTLIPASALAQWTFTPGYQVGTPDWTFDSAFQDARQNAQSQQNTTRQNQMIEPYQTQRIDPRTVKRIDIHEDIQGYGRFNVVERPAVGY